MKNQTLGMMIVRLRKEHNMTQEQLAAKMNVTDKAVSKWERDISCPDIASLPRLAEIFGVSVDELMQVKERGEAAQGKGQVARIIELAFKALTLAMGVAVTVLAILQQLDMQTACIMLGIGLFSAGISLLNADSRS